MKNFLGSLKHKPKKIDLIGPDADVFTLANSVDGVVAQPKDGQIKSILASRYEDQN